jgi:hypothetical protein
MTNTYQHRVLKKANILMTKTGKGSGPQFKEWLRQGEGPPFGFKLDEGGPHMLQRGSRCAHAKDSNHRPKPSLRINQKLPASYQYAIQDVQKFLRAKLGTQPTVDAIALWIAVAAWGHLKVIELKTIQAASDDRKQQIKDAKAQSAAEQEQKAKRLADKAAKAEKMAAEVKQQQLEAARDEGGELDDWESAI